LRALASIGDPVRQTWKYRLQTHCVRQARDSFGLVARRAETGKAQAAKKRDRRRAGVSGRTFAFPKLKNRRAISLLV